MTIQPHEVYSDLPIPPGEILDDELKARGMTQRELAARLDRPPQAVNEIIRGKKAITPDTAIKLGRALGGDPGFWLRLETRYQMTLALNREKRELRAQSEWLAQYPIAELTSRGWLPDAGDAPDLTKALQEFLGVANVDPEVYRKAVGYDLPDGIDPGALAAWLRIGELNMPRGVMADYSAPAAKAIATAEQLAGQAESEFIARVVELCAAAGIAYCVAPALPGAVIATAARWATQSKAIIQTTEGNLAVKLGHAVDSLPADRRERRFVISGPLPPDRPNQPEGEPGP